MIEAIKTYSQRDDDGIRNQRTKVVVGVIYRCKECGIFFSSILVAEKHKCEEHIDEASENGI